jgi:hypothetical protein
MGLVRPQHRAWELVQYSYSHIGCETRMCFGLGSRPCEDVPRGQKLSMEFHDARGSILQMLFLNWKCSYS